MVTLTYGQGQQTGMKEKSSMEVIITQQLKGLVYKVSEKQVT